MTSSSISPVSEALPKVLYATTASSKAPDLHSSINSARDLAFGSTMVANSDTLSHSLCALYVGYQYSYTVIEANSFAVVVKGLLVNASKKKNCWFSHGSCVNVAA